MTEDENEKMHQSRDIEFTDGLKSFHMWWDVFNDAIETNSNWIKEDNFDKFLLMLREFLPKKTKIMQTAFLKDIVEIKDLRLLILLSNLYFEYFIDTIFTKRLPTSSRILEPTFNKKLKRLSESKIIDDSFYTELKFVNYLRNKYAHNLYFDVLDSNFNRSSLIKNLKVLDRYRSNRAKKKLYDFILRIYLIYLVFIFSYNFRETNLLDVMKK